MIEKILDKYVFKFIDKAVENYQKPSGFFSIIAVIEILYLKFGSEYLTTSIPMAKPYQLHILVALISIFTLYQWVKYPINPKNKVGIFLAISNRYADEEARKFLKKIYYEVEMALSDSVYGGQFNVILLDEHKSQKIIRGGKKFIENRSKLTPSLKDSNWHFILFGDLKKDTLRGKLYYRLKPEYAVRHKIIPMPVSISMGQDFKKFLIAQPWQFPVSEGLMALEIFTINIKDNILYALGSAAYVSGLINVARRLHEDLNLLIKPRIAQEEHLRPLFKKLQEILAKENHILANFYFGKDEIDKAIAHQGQAILYKPNFYRAHLFLATYYYEKGEAYYSKVEEHLKLAEANPESSAHKLSRGYIAMERDGLYQFGTDLYIESLRAKTIPQDILLGTLEFLKKREGKNPKPYLVFLEGLIYYIGLDNKASAMLCFNKFISENTAKSEFRYLVEKVESYLKECR